MSEEQVAGNGGSLTRREWLKLGAVSAAAAGCATGRSSVAKSDRPNILFLMADQFRGDCLGVDGNPFIDTPNLDWLARDGVRFSSAYSCTPTCTPARAALLTGLQPWNHGMLGYSRVAEQYPFEMIQALRDGGYYTAGIGKMHWHPQRNAHGFHQVLLDESGRAVVLFNRGNSDEEISVAWNDIGYPNHLSAEVRDLWLKKDMGRFKGSFAATVPSGGVVTVKIMPADGDKKAQ